ncbi:MAG: ATP-binding cassette domain-containing protein [Gammaproteobacteria bacterium]|nr:ATP-binding cassette domain-containing protein [Gammaproteobacteria bacterium]MBQ0775177.1 ATP-binding cassette domain-containing protein [Gammaproteobacteria bacterium]
MIELLNLRLCRGADALFENANVRLHTGWKVGLGGRNGCGKSSLLTALRGELEADTGDISIPADWRIAVMAQEVPALAQAALDYVLDGNAPLRLAEAALQHAEQQQDGLAIAAAHSQLDSIQAWSQPARAAIVLAGLGFSESTQSNSVASFSGGWRMRLNLARVLLADADLLLLDEPTNHLDLDAVLWLEDWLKSCASTIVLISHDRHFLDSVVGHMLFIEHNTLTLYSGNYSQFERQRAEHLAQQQHLREKQQAQAAHLQKFVDRFRAQATKAKQAQSRLKALARMETIGPAHVDSGFSFSFHAPEKLPNPMLDLRKVSCGYNENTIILSDVSLSIRPETRLGLLGPNGAGKSTFIKTLAQQLAPQGGALAVGPDLVIGYFHQQQVDALPMNETPFALMQRKNPRWEEGHVRKELGRFGFQGDEVFAQVGRFSGGEKSRLALALLVQEKPALLLLDEPANHLDLDMREALTLALQDFPGAVILVSHDRHLLDTSVDELVLVANGTVTRWDDDLDAYARWLRERNSKGPDTSASSADAEPSASDARQRRQEAAQKRETLRPLKREVDKLDKKLAQLSSQLSEVESLLGDSTLYQSERAADLNAALQQQGQLKKQRDDTEDALLAAMEQLEDAG